VSVELKGVAGLDGLLEWHLDKGDLMVSTATKVLIAEYMLNKGLITNVEDYISILGD